jgi:hypothetical protein
VRFLKQQETRKARFLSPPADEFVVVRATAAKRQANLVRSDFAGLSASTPGCRDCDFIPAESWGILDDRPG